MDLGKETLLTSHRFTVIHYVAAVLIFIVCAYVSFLASRPDTPEQAQEEAQASSEVTHGPIDGLDSAPGEAKDWTKRQELLKVWTDRQEEAGGGEGGLEGREGPAPGGVPDDAGEDQAEDR